MTLQAHLPDHRPRGAARDPSPVPACRPARAGVGPATGALLAAAQRAKSTALSADDLSSVWQDILDGRLVVLCEGTCPHRSYVFARKSTDIGSPSRPLKRIETAVLVRVLCGEQQKVVAAELGIACSTASKWYTLALSKMNLDRDSIPLPLVLAAQSWGTGDALTVGARSALFEHEGCEFFVLSVPRPSSARGGGLTHAEQAVARILIEGGSRWEIAVLRSTSAQTVACQLRGIFVKFRLTGRYALIRHTAGLGWFR